jgi:hypothetical protein
MKKAVKLLTKKQVIWHKYMVNIYEKTLLHKYVLAHQLTNSTEQRPSWEAPQLVKKFSTLM